jgi:Beta-galactosidase
MKFKSPLVPTLQQATPGNVLARFDVDEQSRTNGLLLAGHPDFQIEPKGDAETLALQPSGRYYEEDAWQFRVADPVLRGRGDLVLEVEFWDEGYGLIQARRLADPAHNGRYAAPARAVSYTRLNSGRFRKAAFLFAEGQPAAEGHDGQKADFELTGIQYLHSARLVDSVPDTYWADLQAAIPAITTPAVALTRPMQVVCSAGVDVRGDAACDRAGMLERSMANLREEAPLAKALGFNAVEAYVRWNVVEPEQGKFDWSFYDTVVDELQRFDLKLFPLLIVGSAHALPQWFHDSEENVGFVCLEHGLSNPVQSIWSPYHKPHVTRFLQAFGAHYEPMGCLQGVRLGPSGCYGESQYPAQGDWGFRGKHMHLHIGMWAGDPYALADFQQRLREDYGTIADLNQAWEEAFASFDDVPLVLPEQCASSRQRFDIYTWYTDSMTDWCEWWAIEARRAMPNTPIYQSAGGWGAAEAGTDYSGQTKSMLKVNGGIRLTNELDSFPQAFYATRLATTAARSYDVPLGFEPAMGHTARGTAGRIFNCVSNGGEHFFTYGRNIFSQQTSIESWLKHYPLFDQRSKPFVEVALLYPQTMNFLSSNTFRYLNAWGFNPIAREIRDRLEVDYLDDRLILDGFLDSYKALVFVWGDQLEKEVIERIDQWLRSGGTIIFPYHLNSSLGTVEGDTTTFDRWMLGEVGEGRFFRYRGDDDPPSLYADFVASSLADTPTLSTATRIALEAEHPAGVFISAQEDGSFLMLNFSDRPAKVVHPAIDTAEIAPYTIGRVVP